VKTKNKLEFLKDENPDYLLADGFDDAIVGTVERYGMNTVVLYNKNTCIDILMKDSEMTEDEAIDYFYYNVIGSYAGEYTPCFAEIL